MSYRLFQRNIPFLLIISFIAFITGCNWFEEQNHAITEPTLPEYRVHGVVTNQSGTGLPGMDMLLIQFEFYDYEGEMLDTLVTITNVDGEYEFLSIPRGGYKMVVFGWGILPEVTEFGVINHQDRELNITVKNI